MISRSYHNHVSIGCYYCGKDIGDNDDCTLHNGNFCCSNCRAKLDQMGLKDVVDHPKHYTSHPSGIECIDITRHFNFCLGNAIKYIWRADLKNNDIEDLKKARKYIDFEIERRTKQKEI